MLKLDLPRTTEERLLVERATGRDAEAFGQLYDMHVVRVYRHIYYLVNSISEAEDLTAQTFLQAWEAMDRYEDRGVPFVSWLLRIAHNLAVVSSVPTRGHVARRLVDRTSCATRRRWRATGRQNA
jgi:DNA-directed RNA polymerase specialized sigma24 family protein